jgi:hypothetical protein
MQELYNVTYETASLNLPKKLTEVELRTLVVNLEARAIKAETKLASYEYLVAYANDIIETWPSITMRTLWRMTEKVATLKQALKEIL